MRITLRLDGGPLRRWVLVLIDRIEALPGLTLSVDRPPPPPARLRPEDLLLRAEAVLARRRLDGWAGFATEGPPVRTAPPGADLVLDLRGDASAQSNPRPGNSPPAHDPLLRCRRGNGGLEGGLQSSPPSLEASFEAADAAPQDEGDRQERPSSSTPQHWCLTVEGRPGEGALLAAVAAGRSPLVALEQDGAVVASARVGTEMHGDGLAVIEDALARTVTLIVAALRGLTPQVEAPREAPPPLTHGRVAAHAARRGAAKLGRGLDRLRHRPGHWRVGWRRLDGPDLIDARAMPATGWTDLPDDGARFYADPFPVADGDRVVLFVEEYPYARGKGLIAAVEFGPEGPCGTPVPVLEEPHHLSYPFVFARDGAHWMVPESGAAGTVDLYQATAFPGGWVKEATLLAGVVASDATLVEHEGLWWMLATVREDTPGLPPRGSASDALHLWSAPDFRGPWTPHPRNPVLIDIASARPAGRIVRRGGSLIRPVQDGRLGYGAAMALARIDRLDGEGYAQTVETRLAPGSGWPGTGLHTLNRCGAFEFIDGLGRSRR